MKINVNLFSFTVVQFAIVTLLVVLGLSSYLFSHITGISSLLGFLRLLDVGEEQSIPTYFSSLNLFLSSILLFIIYRHEKLNSYEGFKYWLFLSVLFLFLSVDESASIHENFGNVHAFLSRKGIASPILGKHTWIPFGVLFILVVGICIYPLFKRLPKPTLFLFVASGIIFVVGAVGLEFVGLLMLKTGFIDSRDHIYYLIRRIFEEGFEMYGVAIFNCALCREIFNRKIALNIGVS